MTVRNKHVINCTSCEIHENTTDTTWRRQVGLNTQETTGTMIECDGYRYTVKFPPEEGRLTQFTHAQAGIPECNARKTLRLSARNSLSNSENERVLIVCG